jgi:hypothetical protein
MPIHLPIFVLKLGLSGAGPTGLKGKHDAPSRVHSRPLVSHFVSASRYHRRLGRNSHRRPQQ